MTPNQIRAITDPLERAKAAQGFLSRGKEAMDEVRILRDDAIADLLVLGRSQRDVARELDVSPAHVAQVAQARKLRTTRTVERP